MKFGKLVRMRVGREERIWGWEMGRVFYGIFLRKVKGLRV